MAAAPSPEAPTGSSPRPDSGLDPSLRGRRGQRPALGMRCRPSFAVHLSRAPGTPATGPAQPLRAPRLTRAVWPVHEDPAGGVPAQQVTDERQDHEQGLGGSRQGQAGQALGEGGHQVGREVAGQGSGCETGPGPLAPPPSPGPRLQKHRAGQSQVLWYSRRGQEEVGQVEETGPVLDVKDGRVQEAIELPVEVGVLPVGQRGRSSGWSRARELRPPRPGSHSAPLPPSQGLRCHSL